MVQMIGFEEAEALLGWVELTDHLERSHQLARAEISDQLLTSGDDSLLSRAAWIKGEGSLVKTALVVPANAGRGLPTANGAVTLFDDKTGRLTAVIDFRLVTKWKTAADSLLAARRLARPESARLLIIGAGAVARSLVEAYSSVFPRARYRMWNRTEGRLRSAVAACSGTVEVEAADDLAAAVRDSDIVACATMSAVPVIRGEWLAPGTHVDLIGAFRPDMREADDEALRRAKLFVDSRETTLAHIGEIKIPLEAGVIAESDVIADFYDLAAGRFARTDPEEITLFKNGGGAHLDLMTARYILEKWNGSRSGAV